MSRMPSHTTKKLLKIGCEQSQRAERQADPYKLERRREDREQAKGMMAASYSNGEDRFGITHLTIVDRSETGLGVRTRTRIDPGMVVTICPEGSTIPWIGARAARCERESDGGYRVGLKLNVPAAA